MFIDEPRWLRQRQHYTCSDVRPVLAQITKSSSGFILNMQPCPHQKLGLRSRYWSPHTLLLRAAVGAGLAAGRCSFLLSCRPNSGSRSEEIALSRKRASMASVVAGLGSKRKSPTWSSTASASATGSKPREAIPSTRRPSSSSCSSVPDCCPGAGGSQLQLPVTPRSRQCQGEAMAAGVLAEPPSICIVAAEPGAEPDDGVVGAAKFNQLEGGAGDAPTAGIRGLPVLGAILAGAGAAAAPEVSLISVCRSCCAAGDTTGAASGAGTGTAPCVSGCGVCSAIGEESSEARAHFVW